MITKLTSELIGGTRLSASAHGVAVAVKPVGTSVGTGVSLWRQRPGYLGSAMSKTDDNSTCVSEEERRHS